MIIVTLMMKRTINIDVNVADSNFKIQQSKGMYNGK